MDVIELRRQRAELVGQLNEIHAAHDGEALGEEVQGRWDELRTGIDALDGQIARAEEIALLNGGAEEQERQSQRRRQADLGLSEGERQSYSFLRALRAFYTNDWSAAGFERECHNATEQRIGEPAQGFYVPADIASMSGDGATASVQVRTPDGYRFVQEDRAVGPGGSGANLIATDLLSDQFIDLLRNRMVIQQAGARVLRDLSGNVAIPRQSAAATFEWKSDDAETTITDSTYDQVTLTPKTGSAATEITRQQMLQSSVDMEQLIKSDVAQVIALGFDAGGLYGTGASGQPQGVKGATGVGNPSTNTPTWATVVEFETLVATANAEMGRLAYVTSALLRGKFKTTEKVATTGQFVWQGGATPLNERPAYVSQQISDADGGANLTSLFYGNWGDLLIGIWGALDLLVDPYSEGRRGRVRLVAHMNGDIGLRHGSSFAYKAIDMS